MRLRSIIIRWSDPGKIRLRCQIPVFTSKIWPKKGATFVLMSCKAHKYYFHNLKVRLPVNSRIFATLFPFAAKRVNVRLLETALACNWILVMLACLCFVFHSTWKHFLTVRWIFQNFCSYLSIVVSTSTLLSDVSSAISKFQNKDAEEHDDDVDELHGRPARGVFCFCFAETVEAIEQY